MAEVRVTIQLDRETLASVDKDAARASKPRSEVLRQAIESRYPNRGPVSEAERRRRLRIIDEYTKQPPTRTQAEADRELREIRASRRLGWSRPSDFK
jgi:metal-responsive CopG/Arc/MetJ family transcriptional regulator